MSGAYKTLNKSDVIISPYITNKQWLINSASFSDYGIYIFKGANTSSNELTDNGEYVSSIYDSIKHLYYINYISASSETVESGSYISYNQSSNDNHRYFPTAFGSSIRVLSIPHNIFGSKISPNTFNISGSNLYIKDDGNGNLYDDLISTSSYVGNIIYTHGMVIFPSSSYVNVLTSSGYDVSFKSEYIIFENQIRCNVKESNFNLSLNPTLTDRSGSYYSFTSASYFSPYATTIGLYNEDNELLVVGKFAKPIPISQNTDMNFVVSWDK